MAIVFVALIAWCSRTSPKYRRMTRADHCVGMPVHAGPTGPLVGYLIGGAIVDPGTGPVQAINVSVVVDGEVSQNGVCRSKRWRTPRSTFGCRPNARYARPARRSRILDCDRESPQLKRDPKEIL